MWKLLDWAEQSIIRKRSVINANKYSPKCNEAGTLNSLANFNTFTLFPSIMLLFRYEIIVLIKTEAV